MSDESFYEYIKELIDQWNLKVTLSSEDFKLLLTTISEKAIKLEFITSLAIVVFWSIVVIVCTMCFLKSRKSFKESFKIVIESMKNNKSTRGIGKDIFRFMLIVTYILVLVMIIIPVLFTNCVDLFECYYFPEKVVMDFFGQYMK